jgi:hypothetical protein
MRNFELMIVGLMAAVNVACLMACFACIIIIIVK